MPCLLWFPLRIGTVVPILTDRRSRNLKLTPQEKRRLKGATGVAGPGGATGPTGPAGPGVTTGGTAGQVLAKIDGTDFNTQWAPNREVLAANRTYYVATTGSDSNDGLTVGTPFLTIQKAVDTVAGLDLGIFDATISMADGAYSGPVTLKTIVGAGRCIIKGNETTPANVTVTTTTAVTGAFGFAPGSQGGYRLSGMKFIANVSNGFGIFRFNTACTVELGALEFGICRRAPIFNSTPGLINIVGPLTLSGNCASFIEGELGSVTNWNSGSAPDLIIVGTVAFSTAFVLATTGAAVVFLNFTSSGSATGPRALTRQGGFISTGAFDPNFLLPGNSNVIVEGWTGGTLSPPTGNGNRLQSFTVAGAPSAATAMIGSQIHISNPSTGNPRAYTSNGTNWYDGAGVLLA